MAFFKMGNNINQKETHYSTQAVKGRKMKGIEENRDRRLEEEAVSLLKAEVLAGLKEWYEFTLLDKWKYVIFAVRRSYMLALIMEMITGRKMEESSVAAFLTDAAFFLRYKELAEIFDRQQQFPPILICDEIIIHGRNINHIMDGITNRIYEELGGKYSEDTVRAAFARAVVIHVYTRNSGQLLLREIYERNLHFIRKEEPLFFRQLSSDISLLIMRADITNACYVFTRHLSDDDVEKVDLNGYISTSYQNVKQDAEILYLREGDIVKAISTIRLIKNINCDGYRVAPFVFLPNLDSDETMYLANAIAERIPDEEIRKWFLELNRIGGKRTFNELISLLLSNVILQEFEQKNGFTVDKQDKERELTKLARNYDQRGFLKTKRMLGKLIDAHLFTMQEMAKLLFCAISDKRLVMMLEGEGHREVPESRKQDIKRKIEDYFYKQGMRDEYSAYELLRRPYFSTPRRAERRVRGCCFTLQELNQGYTKWESNYCMAYFLQMMDAGVTGLSSYAPNNASVVGFAQFAKAGEISLLIKPLRFYEYLPMLIRVEFEAGRRMLNIADELREFCSAFPKQYSSSLVADLVKFVEALEQTGQFPGDWSGGYIDRIEIKAPDNFFTLLDRRRKHLEHYADYAKKKFY